ncbi:MAG: hypothetical protein JWM36_3188 [Hyphomicrobiales bacterium]|nr:hypothetical protein [Hyphomicrobiales bacterium]
MSNTIDSSIAKQFVGDIQRHLADKESLRGEFMQRCKTINEHISDVKDRAKEAGIPRKALNTILKKMDLTAKIEGLTDGLDEEEIEQVELLEAALGTFADTPLGASAVEKAEARQQERASKVRSLTADPSAENVTRLRDGIKQLKDEG